MHCIEETPSQDASVGRTRPPWSDHRHNRRNQAEAQPSQTNSSQPLPRAPVRLWAEGAGPMGIPRPGKEFSRPLPSISRPLPSIWLARTGGPWGTASWALLASWQGLASPVYRWVFVLAVRRFPAHLCLPLTGCCTVHTSRSVGLSEPRAVKKLPTSGVEARSVPGRLALRPCSSSRASRVHFVQFRRIATSLFTRSSLYGSASSS